MSRRVRLGESAEFRVVMRFSSLSWLVLRLVRQAGGHWFKPSTAHLSLSRTGHRDERDDPDAAGGTILCEAV